MPAETKAPTAKSKRQPRPRFWVGPLVAGACFALGYGITQRFVLIRSGLQTSEPQSFKARAFPGESLEALRLRHGENGTLQADVAAKEKIDAKASKQADELKKVKLAKELEQRKAKEEAERIAAAAIERERSQQAVVNTPRPVEDIPTLNEPAPAAEPEVPVMVESVVVEPERAEPELFVTPVEAPPAP